MVELLNNNNSSSNDDDDDKSNLKSNQRKNTVYCQGAAFRLTH
jgi:hypothetical protein